MYRPPQFREDRFETLFDAIAQVRLATLVTWSGAELLASHIPMLLKSEGESAWLEGHVARANSQWRSSNTETDALAIFLGPHAYVSPTYYASKREHGKVVPTWNYLSVHARGKMSIVEDVGWLMRHVSELSDFNEAERPMAWSVSDAPADYIDGMLKAIVGVRLDIVTVEGAWKMAQHRSPEDRVGTASALALSDRPLDKEVGMIMRDLEEQRKS